MNLIIKNLKRTLEALFTSIILCGSVQAFILVSGEDFPKKDDVAATMLFLCGPNLQHCFNKDEGKSASNFVNPRDSADVSQAKQFEM